jgi:D-xylose transport system ATP-binding protein
MIPLLSVRGLNKAYSGVQALVHVDLDLTSGEIHALCGENGAGKSTLIKILGGILPWGSYGGTVIRKDMEVRAHGPRDAQAQGTVVIHQELALAPDLTVSENIFLGREKIRWGYLDTDTMHAETLRLLNVLGETSIRPDQIVRELTVGKKQMVEVARALLPNSHGAKNQDRILILDEPTSALSERESRILLELLLSLKSQGLAIVYVSHKLDEVFAIADRITVLRNGRSIETLSRAEANPSRVVAAMLGRKLEEVFPERLPCPARQAIPLLSVRDWTIPSLVNPLVSVLSAISFELYPGEILGLAGLMGSGRTELVESLFGLSPTKGQGEIKIDGKVFHPEGPGTAVAQGIALVPEDRRHHGLMLEKSIRHNLTLACLKRFCRMGQLIDEDLENQQARESIQTLGVKAPDGEFTVGMLSGGNQQKVVLAKWLLTKPRILFLDDPTRGVDVGAKSEIYRIIQQRSQAGIGIILISSENEEVLRLAHRILVLRQGKLVGEFAGGEADSQTILELCAGGANR